MRQLVSDRVDQWLSVIDSVGAKPANGSPGDGLVDQRKTDHAGHVGVRDSADQFDDGAERGGAFRLRGLGVVYFNR